MDIDTILEELTQIVSNLKRNPNRSYREKTIKNKLEQIEALYDNSLLLIEDVKEDKTQKFLLQATRNIYAEAKTLLQQRLKLYIRRLTLKTICKIIIAFQNLYKRTKPNGAINMATKVDLTLAIRIVEKYDGDAATLENWLNDVDVLHEHDTEVSPANFLSFMKSRLIGAARGTIDSATSLEEAKLALRLRFGVKLTPIAVEAELRSLRQKNKSVVEFAADIEKLSTKLAAAWVAKQPTLFPNEAAAKPVIEPVAVDTFIQGLKDQSVAYCSMTK